MRRPAPHVAAVAAVMCAVQLPVAAYADVVNWQAVAKCESGGNWSADTGNGAYGGLQIKPSTWQANGGIGLPSQASPQQQITVAKRVLADQGPGAWPTCISRGLTGGGPGRAPDTGGMFAPPVGSLTHFLTTLLNDAEAPPGG